MDKKKVFAKNRYGISIVKCCASCRFKKCDSRTRLCTNGEGSVPSDYLCRNWEMAYGLDNAGKGGGKVKRAAYLQYSCDVLSEENARLIEASIAKRAYMRKTLDEIRNEFIDRHGNIYVYWL